MHRRERGGPAIETLGQQLREHDLRALGMGVEARAVELAPVELEVVGGEPCRVHAGRGDEDDLRGRGPAKGRTEKAGEEKGATTPVAKVSSWPTLRSRVAVSTPAL